jgi:hypothetical protein
MFEVVCCLVFMVYCWFEVLGLRFHCLWFVVYGLLLADALVYTLPTLQPVYRQANSTHYSPLEFGIFIFGICLKAFGI